MKTLSTIDRHFYKNLGLKLNCIRINKCKSYREMSAETGLSRTTIDNFFLGKTRIKDNNFELICKSLGITTSNAIRLILS